jgi:hypothetical protein
VNNIWKLKYENGTWIVLFHPNNGEFTNLTPEDMATVFRTKPTVEDLRTQVWADDLIERYLDLGDYSDAKGLLEQFKMPK